MPKRTTIELDEELLNRAKRALGLSGTRATVEEALRRAADSVEGTRNEQVARQRGYLRQLEDRADPKVLGSGEMWR